MWALGATPVSAAENARIPFVGRILLALQAMLVDRERGAKLQATSSVAPAGVAPAPSAAEPGAGDVNAKIRQRALDDRFPRILLFPEGTTTNGSAVLSFKPGAFKPAVPVQPVVVSYPHTFFDPSWVSEGPSMYRLVLGLMCQIYNRVQVTYLPVYTPSDPERADPQLFADNVQRAMAAALRVPATRFSYEDIMLGNVAVAHAPPYPVPHSVVEFNALKTAVSLDVNRARQLLRRFISLDTAHVGSVDFGGFCAFFRADRTDSARRGFPASPSLQTPSSTSNTYLMGSGEGAGAVAEPPSLEPELRRLAAVLDANGDGRLTFRDLLLGFSLVTGQGLARDRDALRVVFLALDVAAAGGLQMSQIERFTQATVLESACPDLAPLRAAAGAPHGLVSWVAFSEWAVPHAGVLLPAFRAAFLGFREPADLLAVTDAGR